MTKKTPPRADADRTDPGAAPHNNQRLLYSREQVAELLGGISVHTVRRLEAAGRLRPVRLTRSPTAMVFFRAQDVLALIEEADDA
jgi:hypothetical protein